MEQMHAVIEKHHKWLIGAAGGERADLRSADLSSAKFLDPAVIERRRLCPDGDFTAYKRLADGSIATLRIPAAAARVGGCIGRKCRAEFAIVVSGSGRSIRDSSFVYEERKEVRPAVWDPNPLVECSGGIHFFITRLEAEEYS